jgi:ABC-2 type transport system ATP-binding protein
LWAGAEMVSEEKKGDVVKVKVKIKGANTPNDLLMALLPSVEIVSFNEVIPSMNDIFIQAVGEKSNLFVNGSNFTE